MRNSEASPFTVTTVNSETILGQHNLHPVMSLEGLFIGFARSKVSYLVDTGPCSHLVEIDAGLLEPRKDLFETMLIGNFYAVCDVEVCKAFFLEMYENPFPPLPHDESEGISVVKFPDLELVAKDSGYRQVPMWKNVLYKITVNGLLQAFITLDGTYILRIPSSLVRPKRLTEFPGKTHVCPENPNSMRCCISCGHSQGEEECKLALLGLKCCKIDQNIVDVVRNALKDHCELPPFRACQSLRASLKTAIL